jgi:glutathione synthase/RimK-type ligase-like ATP-grasp enzyme
MVGKMSRRILITSAGSGQCNNLMRSLLHGDASTLLIGCHSDRFVLKKSAAKRNFLVPVADPEDGVSPAFDQALRSVIAITGVDLIIPGNDRDALVLARINERECLPCCAFLAKVRTIALCQDKYALNVLLRDQHIPVPRTYPVRDRASLIEAWRTLAPGELAWCRIRRGVGSRGATKVRDADQAWNWIDYWHTMRGVPVEDFTLSEFLPGRDYNVQGLWLDGNLVLIKMCERISYLNADQNPSGMGSTPALAKTVWEPAAIEACEAAIRAVDRDARGVFNFDLKENKAGVPCITEINAGRFAMITNLYDLTGRHNMAATYGLLACGASVHIDDPYDDPGEHYLVRELDTLPEIFGASELFERIVKA